MLDTIAVVAAAAVATADDDDDAAAAAAGDGWWLTLMPRITATVAAFVVFTMLAAVVKRLMKVWQLEKIPGPFALPFIGNALDIRGSHQALFKTMQRYCGYGRGVSRFYMGMQAYVFLYRAQPVYTMLNSSFQMDKSKDYTYLQPWMGTGLITARGHKWRGRRQLVTPSFHFTVLDEFVAVMQQRSRRLLSHLDHHVDQDMFDVAPIITLCTLDIIMGAVMGCDFNVQQNSDCEYVRAIKGMGELVQTRQSSPWLQNTFLFSLLGYKREQDAYVKVLHATSRNAIKRRREEPHHQPEADQVIGQQKHLSFLDLLLEQTKTGEGTSLTDEDIREELDTFMFAGHATTASAISFCLYLLARHPKIQESVHEELCTVTGDGALECSHLEKLQLLERCIKESLRIFPPVPSFARNLLCTRVFDGYVVPGGTTVMVNTYALHRDPVHFPDPERFDPDRFLPEACAARHPYAYIPFSAGFRNCLGQKFAMLEQKVVLGSILRRFRVTSTQEPHKLQLKGELVLQADNGIHISLSRRF